MTKLPEEVDTFIQEAVTYPDSFEAFAKFQTAKEKAEANAPAVKFKAAKSTCQTLRTKSYKDCGVAFCDAKKTCGHECKVPYGQGPAQIVPLHKSGAHFYKVQEVSAKEHNVKEDYAKKMAKKELEDKAELQEKKAYKEKVAEENKKNELKKKARDKAEKVQKEINAKERDSKELKTKAESAALEAQVLFKCTATADKVFASCSAEKAQEKVDKALAKAAALKKAELAQEASIQKEVKHKAAVAGVNMTEAEYKSEKILDQEDSSTTKLLTDTTNAANATNLQAQIAARVAEALAHEADVESANATMYQTTLDQTLAKDTEEGLDMVVPEELKPEVATDLNYAAVAIPAGGQPDPAAGDLLAGRRLLSEDGAGYGSGSGSAASAVGWAPRGGACRGSSASDIGSVGTDFVKLSKSIADCKDACQSDATCKAVEVRAGNHCELWSTLPQFSSTSTAHQCIAIIRSAGMGDETVPEAAPVPEATSIKIGTDAEEDEESTEGGTESDSDFENKIASLSDTESTQKATVAKDHTALEDVRNDAALQVNATNKADQALESAEAKFNNADANFQNEDNSARLHAAKAAFVESQVKAVDSYVKTHQGDLHKTNCTQEKKYAFDVCIGRNAYGLEVRQAKASEAARLLAKKYKGVMAKDFKVVLESNSTFLEEKAKIKFAELAVKDDQKKLVDDKDDLSETQTQIKEQKEKLAASKAAQAQAQEEARAAAALGNEANGLPANTTEEQLYAIQQDLYEVSLIQEETEEDFVTESHHGRKLLNDDNEVQSGGANEVETTEPGEKPSEECTAATDTAYGTCQTVVNTAYEQCLHLYEEALK